MGIHSFEHVVCFSSKRTRGREGNQKEFEIERAVTEAELSCRAQAVRGESYIVQSSMEVSQYKLYPSDKWDYTFNRLKTGFQKSFNEPKI